MVLPMPCASGSSGKRMRTLSTVMDRGKRPPDVPLEGIVERDRRGEPPDLAIGDGGLPGAILDQDVLDDLDRRTQANAAGRFRQSSQQVE